MTKLAYYLVPLIFFSCDNLRKNGSNDGSLKNVDPDKSLLIAYNVLMTDSGNTDNYEILSMDLNGENKSRLTNNPDVTWTYLAIKDKIMFISDRDTCYRCFFLYEMNWDGSMKRKVNNFLLRDSWMSSRKNGEEIIVTPAKDSLFYIINREGKIMQKVPTHKVYFNDPCFSPNGEQIVFRGADQKFKKDSGYIDELYIMDSDGNNIRQLTTYPPKDTTAEWYNYHAGPPRWHPTENFISYQSKQNGKSSLYGISPDGKNQWKLTSISDNEGWHDWSYDGVYLAVGTHNADENQFDISLFNWKTKTFKTLTDTTYKYQHAPVFVTRSSQSL